MRHSATRALLERDDVVIVASVSCIYGIGSVETYSTMTMRLPLAMKFSANLCYAALRNCNISEMMSILSAAPFVYAAIMLKSSLLTSKIGHGG